MAFDADTQHLVGRAAERFGSQCIVVAIDGRAVGEGRWEVFTHGGRRPTGLDAVEWAKQVVALGAGELLVTSSQSGEGIGDLRRSILGAV